ncbi:MAG TPA: hypothetical protein VH643_01770 [Gemmataceae bacterium]
MPRIQSLDDLPEGDSVAVEWQTFKRTVARLLAEGCGGKLALVKGDAIIGVWDTLREALHEGQKRFGQEDFLVQEIQPFLPFSRNGYRRLCRD